jgi:DMSO/TMAO reductase YedYZ molybdopterin-dependent catalytic subunit
MSAALPDQSYGWPAPTPLQGNVKAIDDRGRALAVASRLSEQETALTPTSAFYAVQHFSPPDDVVDPEAFTLTIDGCVREPLKVGMDVLRSLPVRTVTTVLECSGNGQDDFLLPQDESRVGDPRFAAGGSAATGPRLLEFDEYLASAGEFTGVPLRAVLDLAGIERGAVAVRAEGRDCGVPDADMHGLPAELVDVPAFNYDKALPLEKALHPDTILAWAMNNERLNHLHGAPLRLVVPGWVGNWSVKWIHRLEVLNQPGRCWYQNDYYYYADSLDDPNRQPITAMPVKSIIVDPLRSTRALSAGRHVIRGLAWSGAGEITGVDVSTDGGKSWHPADLERSHRKWLWRRFSLPVDLAPGHHTIMSRARDEVGRVQPRVPEWNILRKNFNGMVPYEIEVR